MRSRDIAISTEVRTGAIEIGSQGAPVRMKVYRTSPDENTIELSINYEKADVPAKAYFSDYCDVLRGRTAVSVIFGKFSPGTSSLRNKIEIAFPEELFVRQLWKNSSPIRDKLSGLFGAEPLPKVDNFVDTDVVQTFVANNVFMLGMADEALLDFYYIAPSEVHFALAKHRPEVALDPVIRIVLSGALLYEMLGKCSRVVEQLPAGKRILKEEGGA